MRAAPFLISALLVLSAAPAFAQSRQELDERLAAVEAQLRAQPAQNSALANLDRINSLEQQIRTLTGQVEELQFQNRQLEQRVETLNEDLVSALGGGAAFAAGDPLADPGGPAVIRPDGGAPNADLGVIDPNDPFAAQRQAAIRPLGAPGTAGGPGAGALGGGGAGLAAGAAAGTAIGPDGLNRDYVSTGDSPDLLFARGRTLLFEGQFGGALDAFAEFLDIAPNDGRAGEAYFWVGRIYRTEERPTDAADALVKSLQLDDSGPMAPEAMIQLGGALNEMGQGAQACQTLNAALSQYPNMDPAVRNTAVREQRNAGC